MRAVAAGEAATLRRLSGERETYQRDEFSRFIDAALAEKDYDLGVQRILYDQDLSIPHQPGWVPETVLVVTVGHGWGAAYYRGPDRYAWITRNPRPAPNMPELMFDGEAGTNYPANAVIPRDQLRRAVEEYLETGNRPTCVDWQEHDRYMIY